MKGKVFRKMKKYVAIAAAFSLTATTMSAGMVSSVVYAADPEVTSVTHSYDFTSNGAKAKPIIGQIMDGTATETSGILYVNGAGSGCTYDANQLRFRLDTILYLPVNDDTTKVTYSQKGNGSNAGRPTYVGGKESGYIVEFSKDVQTVTIQDVTDLLKEVNGKKYFPIVSGGDVKLLNITLQEFNPINTVTVSGTIANAAANGVTEISFKNLDDENMPVVKAEVKADGSYTATLRRVAGNTNYVASINKSGFMIDAAESANKFTLTGNAADATNNFSVVTAPIAKVSGTFAGVTDEFIKDALSVKLVPEDSAMESVSLTLTKVSDGNYTFSAVELVPDANYSVAITGADDFETTATVSKSEGLHTDVAITAAKKAVYKVAGSFVTSDKSTAKVDSITFKNMNTPEYTYTFAVAGNSYEASLRTGEYETSLTYAADETRSCTVFDHVSVNDADCANDVYVTMPEDTSKVAYAAEVKVGKGEQFETITDALKYIARMDRADDAQVTIKLLDAEYREQLIVEIPNITITSDRTSGSTITWYYGVGYSYYSAKPSTDNKNGCYYDEAYAVDKYYQGTISQNPGHWGAAVNLFAGATGFKAENVTFENSLNRYMTTEEVADGVTTNSNISMIDRSKATNADVLKKDNKERGAALYNQADNVEFKNCNFLSSQDTIYTGDGTENSYYTNCKIEGTTDYICGDGNPVFDTCTLSMYSYSDKEATESYIVASKGTGTHGYLFKDCKIVSTTDTGLEPTSGNILVRAWGPGTVLFDNTEVESAGMISDTAYIDMNSKVTEAHYYEYNTHTPDGAIVDMSKRAAGVTVLAEDPKTDMTTYFDGWMPSFYVADYTAVDAAVKAANALTPADYRDFSAVTAAVNAVVPNLSHNDQAKVNAMAKAITDAIGALEKKTEEPKKVDLTNLNKAIDAAKVLVAGDYVDFSKVAAALTAAQADLSNADQAKVDDLTKVLNDAVSALVKKEEPTTQTPTTEAPTTQAPTTEAPTTAPTTTETPTTAAGTNADNSVNTGDSASAMPYILLMLAAVAGMFVVLTKKKKQL